MADLRSRTSFVQFVAVFETNTALFFLFKDFIAFEHFSADQVTEYRVTTGRLKLRERVVSKQQYFIIEKINQDNVKKTFIKSKCWFLLLI